VEGDIHGEGGKKKIKWRALIEGRNGTKE